MTQKEYGGYIEFEHYHGSIFHEQGVALNCGRNCLAYLIERKRIEKIYLPYFLCDSITRICQKYSLNIEYYHIDKNFYPLLDKQLERKSYMFLVNYYGQLNNDIINNYKNIYKNLIVDNSQAYFQMPIIDTDTIYTCRKFFGVPDGAFLYTDRIINDEFPSDESFERTKFLMGRFERSANEFYHDFIANEQHFSDEPIKSMSLLTQNFLRSIDYQHITKIRKNNFLYLHSKLSTINKLELSIPDGAFMYPLYIKNGADIRKKLQANKIYIPILWPELLLDARINDIERDYVNNILPLPIDQRYGQEEMEYLKTILFKEIS